MTEDDLDLAKVSSVHLVGIGGIGMMALAQYFHGKGVRVSGSDAHASANVHRLGQLGIPVSLGHSRENGRQADLIVISSAVAASNPEVEAAIERGQRIVKRARVLGAIASTGPTIAISGTHGKTTTTALCAHLLQRTGTDVSLLGGGVALTTEATEGPGHAGSSPITVVEADEYDRTFLALHPTIAVLTSLDYDHPDCYPTIGDLEDAFAVFLSQSERILVAGESARATEVAARTSWSACRTYGIGSRWHWSATDMKSTATGTTFTVATQGQAFPVHTRLSGAHNVRNSLAAIAAVSELTGQDPSAFREAFTSFLGVERRLQLWGQVGGVKVFDDYAHHPAEIDAALASLKDGKREVIVIFQPHTFSRTHSLLDDFARALSKADAVALLDVYGAREVGTGDAIVQELSNRIEHSGGRSELFPQRVDAVHFSVETARPGSVIVTMGAGDVGELAPKIVSRLQEVRVVG